VARKRGRYVPWLLGGLMALVIGANLALVYLATSDPSFAVEQDYYRKAVEWDRKRAQDAHNAELGWTLELDVEGARGADGRVGIVARLNDASGRPIADADVRLEAFHNARAGEILRADLAHGSGAVYRTALPLRRPGLWEFRVVASRGADRFTRTAMKELIWR